MKKQLARSKKLWKIGDPAYNTHYFDFNLDGELIVKEGNNTYTISYLAEKLGTPLEIYFPFIVEERVEDLMDLAGYLIKKHQYSGEFHYHYPMKVNQNKEVVMALIGEGANVETSSYNELWLVKKMLEQGTFNMNIRILCNGPKTEKYMILIDELQHRGLKITPIIEGPNELKLLQYSRYDVGLRIDMPVKASSHWNKEIDRFGFTAEEVMELKPFKHLKILHYHVGSQIEVEDDLLVPVRYALEMYHKLWQKNPSLDTLNIGGGLPIPYERTKTVSLERLLEKLLTLLKTESEKYNMPHPNLICEWGRYMVAPSQITVYQVMDNKLVTHKKAAGKKWLILDGSFMNDLPDVWGVNQKFSIVPTSNKNDKNLTSVWLAGASCDSDDIYVGNNGKLMLPDPDLVEDGKPYYLAVLDTGAYQDPLASHHCMLSSPAKIIAQNGHIMVLRRRETPDDVGKYFGW